MKIGLYLENKNKPEADLSVPELGNPGIGGTQFNFLTLPYYFKKLLPEYDVEFVIYTNHKHKLPDLLYGVETDNVFEAVRKCKEDNCDIFIYRPLPQEIKEILNIITEHKLKTIAWVHNTLFETLKDFSMNSYVKRFVCVAPEQLDEIRHHPIFYKSTYIYNGFDASSYKPVETIKKDKAVVYIGALIRQKGFHILAEIWRDILKEVSDAKLWVIGTGNLYSDNAELGKWGIADEKYEKVLRHYLSDDSINPHPSVKFLGLLGKEKVKYLQRAMVGVPNPTGYTEQCPGSAIEIQAAGTPVVSISENGLLDTVLHKKTGYLEKNSEKIKQKTIYLLKNPEKAKKLGQNGISFIEERFAYKKICEEWYKLFDDIINDRPNRLKPMKSNILYKGKLIKEIKRCLRDKHIL